MPNDPINVQIPTDTVGWLALMAIVLPFAAQLLTALIIRWKPDLSSADRFSVSVAVSFFLMLVPGWATLVALRLLAFDLPSLAVVLPAAFAVSGGKEVVYKVGREFWRRITEVPDPPAAEPPHDPYVPLAPVIRPFRDPEEPS
jgi:hypothetical protein